MKLVRLFDLDSNAVLGLARFSKETEASHIAGLVTLPLLGPNLRYVRTLYR